MPQKKIQTGIAKNSIPESIFTPYTPSSQTPSPQTSCPKNDDEIHNKMYKKGVKSKQIKKDDEISSAYSFKLLT